VAPPVAAPAPVRRAGLARRRRLRPVPGRAAALLAGCPLWPAGPDPACRAHHHRPPARRVRPAGAAPRPGRCTVGQAAHPGLTLGHPHLTLCLTLRAGGALVLFTPVSLCAETARSVRMMSEPGTRS